MGLDASVRCRCFEEGKLHPGPVPFDDLYIDEEGYLASRKLDRARKQYDSRRFRARYGLLDNQFDCWSDNCCEHKYGNYLCERVGNSSACGNFEMLVEEAGGEEKYPLLSKLLPDVNGGIYPAKKAKATLEELERFIEEVTDIDQWVLKDRDSDEIIWRTTDSSDISRMHGPFDRVGMLGGKVFFAHEGRPYLETTHFKQIPIGNPDRNGQQKMKIICLDTDEETETFDSLGPKGAPKVEREFYVTTEMPPFLYEGKYWTAERIKNLLVASIETGNPIRWE